MHMRSKRRNVLTKLITKSNDNILLVDYYHNDVYIIYNSCIHFAFVTGTSHDQCAYEIPIHGCIYF